MIVRTTVCYNVEDRDFLMVDTPSEEVALDYAIQDCLKKHGDVHIYRADSSEEHFCPRRDPDYIVYRGPTGIIYGGWFYWENVVGDFETVVNFCPGFGTMHHDGRKYTILYRGEKAKYTGRAPDVQCGSPDDFWGKYRPVQLHS